jgi:O-antigen ligase
MLNHVIKLILIFLLIFTPIAFGSVELWAFSLMELGILLIIILAAIQKIYSFSVKGINVPNVPNVHNGSNVPNVTIILLSLFLCLVLLQMVPLASGIVKIISPQTYELRHQLLMANNRLLMTSLSFVPFATQIEFFKWLTLIALFIYLLKSNLLGHQYRVTSQIIVVIMLVGIFESFYGMFEFFSGHRYILHLEDRVSSVTGTFINRNYFAGYLLMVIPLSVGYWFSREAFQRSQFMGWRNRLSSLDGKTILIAFGIILMILGLLFSASRMGIASLLLSFSLISFLFRESQRGQRFSKTAVLIFGLALLWAAWIGLDAVISRFFSISEGFEDRWLIWGNTFQVFKDFMLFGSGLGTFTQVFPMYRSFHIRGLITHAENDLLQLVAETGLIGAGLMLTIFLFLIFKAIKGIRLLSHRDSGRYIGIGGLIGVLALMFHSLVERNIQVPANALLYTFIWASIIKISTKMTQWPEGLEKEGDRDRFKTLVRSSDQTGQ